MTAVALGKLQIEQCDEEERRKGVWPRLAAREVFMQRGDRLDARQRPIGLVNDAHARSGAMALPWRELDDKATGNGPGQPVARAGRVHSVALPLFLFISLFNFPATVSDLIWTLKHLCKM